MTKMEAALPYEPTAVGDTRLRLLDTAERLFGEYGIEAISLNQITREAGQRNASALNYHFGCKRDLIKAILGRRMEGINRRRMQLLAETAEGDRDQVIHGVARALVVPLADQLEAGEGGRNYVRFVAQVYGDPRIDMFELVRGQHDTSVREITRVVFSLLSDLPRDTARMRLEFVSTLFIHALAERARSLAHQKRVPRSGEIRALTECLINAVVAILGGP